MSENKIEAKFVPDKWNEFREAIKALSKLSKKIKMTVFPDSIHLVGVDQGETNPNVVSNGDFLFALRSILIKDPFEEKVEINSGPSDFFFIDGIKFIKVSTILNSKSGVGVCLLGNEKAQTFHTQKFFDCDLTLDFISARADKFPKITLEQIRNKSKKQDPEIELNIPSDLLEKIRKISSMQTGDDVIEISIDNGILYFSQKDWKIKTQETDSKGQWFFKKTHLGQIPSTEEDVNIKIFNSFMYIEPVEDNALVIALEDTN